MESNTVKIKLGIKLKEQYIFIPFRDIICLVADGNYTTFYYRTPNTAAAAAAGTGCHHPGYYSEQLPAYFERSHDSFLVNLLCVTGINEDGTIFFDCELPVRVTASQRMKKQLLQHFLF
jgi:DNA-binding LytR/AlgR family response regulator